MSVQEIMSDDIVTVEMDDSLKVVKEIFDQASFHHLLVVGSGTLMGVVSDRDLLRALSPNVGTIRETTRDAATLNIKVHQVMTRKPITLREQASVQDAIDLFNQHHVSCVPVVDYRNRPLGIISWRDVLKTL